MMVVDLRNQITGMRAAYLRLAQQINPRIGAAVTRCIQEYLFSKGPNKNGWPSTGFYAAAAKSATWHVLGDGVVVSIHKQGFRQRLEGGVIKPINVKYLTIPARSEAHGKRAGEFGNLTVLWGRNGPYALAADTGGATRKIFQGREGTGKERKIASLKEGVILFWLVKEVNQAPDPSVLPTEEEILDCALRATDDALALFEQRSQS